MAIIEEDGDYTIETSKESLEALGFIDLLNDGLFVINTSYGLISIGKDMDEEYHIYINNYSVGRHLKWINQVKDVVMALYAVEL